MQILPSFLILVTAVALSTSAVADEPSANLPIRDIATDFLRFWDATVSLPTSDRVEIFKRDVQPLFPGFYRIERFKGKMTAEKQDARIANAIEQFATIRTAYADKVARFSAAQRVHSVSFMKFFPDFMPDVPVYLLHSLGEMDGGTREFDGRSVLIFGADVMARVQQGTRSEATFFHHELFHVYHEPKLGNCGAIWCSLWTEGLAVYVSSVLNPGANHVELLLDNPAGTVAATEAALIPSLESLRTVMMRVDASAEAELFQIGGKARSDLPIRRGYYLGYLVAKEIAKDRELRSLAHLDATQSLPLVTAAIEKLLADARSAR